MCMVSMVSDYGQNRIPYQHWTGPSWQEYQSLLEKARKFDAMMGQADCVDPNKDAWQQKMGQLFPVQPFHPNTSPTFSGLGGGEIAQAVTNSMSGVTRTQSQNGFGFKL